MQPDFVTEIIKLWGPFGVVLGIIFYMFKDKEKTTSDLMTKISATIEAQEKMVKETRGCNEVLVEIVQKNTESNATVAELMRMIYCQLPNAEKQVCVDHDQKMNQFEPAWQRTQKNR